MAPPGAQARLPASRALQECLWRNTVAARTLAKVFIVLPAQLLYLAEPTALAFPALHGLVTFLAAQDPAAGRAQLAILLLGNLVGSVAAAPLRSWRSVCRCPHWR